MTRRASYYEVTIVFLTLFSINFTLMDLSFLKFFTAVAIGIGAIFSIQFVCVSVCSEQSSSRINTLMLMRFFFYRSGLDSIKINDTELNVKARVTSFFFIFLC